MKGIRKKMKEEVMIHSDMEAPYSAAIMMDNELYVSGQLPVENGKEIMPEDIGMQTDICMRNIKDLVEKAGFSMTDIVKTTIYTTDISKISQINASYIKYFKKPYPARCACEVSKLARGAKVEIECVARSMR